MPALDKNPLAWSRAGTIGSPASFHWSKKAATYPAQIAPNGRKTAALSRKSDMRTVLALFLIMSGTSATFAQHQGTSQEQQACSRDASKFCRKDLGNDGAVQQCLQGNRAKLSKACQAVFQSHGM